MDHEVRRSRPSWSTWWNAVCTNNTKISWVWWHVPVILATLKAEARESLEPRNGRLQWAEIMPLHSNLGDKVRPYLKKRKKKDLNLECHKLDTKNLASTCCPSIVPSATLTSRVAQLPVLQTDSPAFPWVPSATYYPPKTFLSYWSHPVCFCFVRLRNSN